MSAAIHNATANISSVPTSPDAERAASPLSVAGSLYVINLLASSVPPTLDMRVAPPLSGLAVFRSRGFDEGRDRYRLHLGYFRSVAQAKALLPTARQYYPTAWIAAAPHRGLGSLDDTASTEFRLLQSDAATIADQPVFDLQQQRNVVVRVAQSPQRYVVQLTRSFAALDPREVPQHALFSEYTLYTVASARGDHRAFATRLGFFTDAMTAVAVALSLRAEFPEVKVLPISDREHARALEAVRQERSPFQSTDVSSNSPNARQSVTRRLTNAELYRWEPAFSREQLLELLGERHPELLHARDGAGTERGAPPFSIPGNRSRSTFSQVLHRLAGRR